MSLSEDTGGSSSPESAALGEVLAFFGAVADYTAGCAPEEGERVASLASGMAALAGIPQHDADALYFAARLRNAGALGNAAFAQGSPLSQRERKMQSWDVPADSARVCERIAALPGPTADIVRWQAECWDGTGCPDQLRWSGIPPCAQLLHLARVYAAHADPEEARSAIAMEAGRAFAPEQTQIFTRWFHTYGGEIESTAPPYGSLNAERTPVMQLLETISERIDAHNGTPERGARIARRCEAVAERLGFDADATRRTALAALLFGAGELRAAQLESARFDPLVRLGIAARAEHAAAAAKLVAQCPFLADVAPVLRARAEWYDGTGGPNRLRGDAIPREAHVLAASIAYDAVDEGFRTRITQERAAPISRLENAAGTQFHPDVVRAMAQVVKVQA